MNATDYNSIIDRYIEGALSPSELRRFRELLDIDPDARRMLDAELAVRSTLQSDRDAIPVESERSYARFLGALAATSGGTGADPIAAPRPAGSRWTPARWFATTTGKVVATAVLTVGIVMGGAVATRDGNSIGVGGRPELVRPVDSDRESEERRENLNTAMPTDVREDQPALWSSAPEQSRTRPTFGARWPTHPAERARSTPARPMSREYENEVRARAERYAREVEQLHQPVDELPLIETDSVHGRVNLQLKPGD